MNKVTDKMGYLNLQNQLVLEGETLFLLCILYKTYVLLHMNEINSFELHEVLNYEEYCIIYTIKIKVCVRHDMFDHINT